MTHATYVGRCAVQHGAHPIGVDKRHLMLLLLRPSGLRSQTGRSPRGTAAVERAQRGIEYCTGVTHAVRCHADVTADWGVLHSGIWATLAAE